MVKLGREIIEVMNIEYGPDEFIKRIADKGVDFATILSPHYFVNFMTDEALTRYYTKIADKSPIPVMMYNAPKFAAGLTFSTNLVTALARNIRILPA